MGAAQLGEQLDGVAVQRVAVDAQAVLNDGEGGPKAAGACLQAVEELVGALSGACARVGEVEAVGWVRVRSTLPARHRGHR